MGESRKVVKLSPNKIKKGDLMAIIYYVKVKDVPKVGEEIVVDDLDTNTTNIVVQGASLLKNCLSADAYEEEVQCSRTVLLKVLSQSYNRPLTVCFTKLNGEERVLRGRYLNEVEHEGRSFMEDLDIVGGPRDRFREVDNRTVKFLIVDGTKYTVKKK